MRTRLIALLVSLSAALAAGGFAAAAPAAASTTKSQVHVVVQINRFVVTHDSSIARGIVSAKLTDQAGHITLLRAPVALSASSAGSCQILNLDLKQLNLVLLGLNVHLNEVHLTVTGQSHGGVLGSLFCKLAHAKATAARVAVAHSMNSALRHRPLQPVGFTVQVHPAVATAAAVTCPVLDLTLGPLNLNLLGLVVDLNQVHLTITATQGGGTLGDLFCSLSH
jgi:hypothetical protein